MEMHASALLITLQHCGAIIVPLALLVLNKRHMPLNRAEQFVEIRAAHRQSFRMASGFYGIICDGQLWPTPSMGDYAAHSCGVDLKKYAKGNLFL